MNFKRVVSVDRTPKNVKFLPNTCLDIEVSEIFITEINIFKKTHKVGKKWPQYGLLHDIVVPKNSYSISCRPTKYS